MQSTSSTSCGLSLLRARGSDDILKAVLRASSQSPDGRARDAGGTQDREENFINRHGLYGQFEDEDKRGKR